MLQNEFHKNLNVGKNADLSNFKIFEQGTDVKLQFEFEKITRKLRKGKEFVVDTDEIIDILFDEKTEKNYKKELLVKLAHSEEVKSYRAIEKYTKSNEHGLQQWATLALQRSRAVLETSLSSNQTVFIATGLGGLGDKLRYFFILHPGKNDVFSEFEKEIITKEINYALEINKGIVEEITSKDEYIATMCLVPLNMNLEKIFKAVIKNSNIFGNFLSESVIATNAQKYTHEEINNLLNGKFDDMDDEDIDIDDYKKYF